MKPPHSLITHHSGNFALAAFSSNDYYESDVEGMDLHAPLDITYGPYETYNDEMFGYKSGV